MKKPNHYQVKSSNIIHETIDNEVVVVNLEKGYYYSLRDTAAVIWSNILAGMSVETIIERLSKQHKIKASQVEGSVIDFFQELVEENILSPATSGDRSEDLKDQELKYQEDTKSEEYSSPVLEKFTDMADLLLLDPIHEVDETGWPNIAPDPTDEKP